MTSHAEFLANLLANVGRGITPEPPADEPAPAPTAPSAPIEIVHMAGFTTTDEITVGGFITTTMSYDGFHGAYYDFKVVKVNRVSVVVDIDGRNTRIHISRIIRFRPAN